MHARVRRRRVANYRETRDHSVITAGAPRGALRPAVPTAGRPRPGFMTTGTGTAGWRTKTGVGPEPEGQRSESGDPVTVGSPRI